MEQGFEHLFEYFAFVHVIPLGKRFVTAVCYDIKVTVILL